MDEINAILEDALKHLSLLDERKEQQLDVMRSILYGSESMGDKENTENALLADSDQPKKKAKHLSALIEDEDENSARISRPNKPSRALSERNHETTVSKTHKSPRNSKRSGTTAVIEEATSTTSNSDDIENALLEKTNTAPITQTKSAIDLMPPPATNAVPVNATMSEQSFARPQRAAKLNCVKNLKEPPLNLKLRRQKESEVHIKLEHEERPSQAHEATVSQKSRKNSKSNASTTSATSHDSLICLPDKTPSIVTICDQSDQSSAANELEKSQSNESADSKIGNMRKCSVRIKREKLSGAFGVANTSSTQQSETAALIESTTVQNTTNDTTQTKKGQKKKKIVPKPIKVERLSNIDAEPSTPPVASRTRHGRKSDDQNKNTTSTNSVKTTTTTVTTTASNTTTTKTTVNETVVIAENKKNSNPNINRSDSVDDKTSNAGTPNNYNATMVLGSAPNDATYCTAAASTFVVNAQSPPNVAASGDLTFDVATNMAASTASTSQRSSDQSMATARDTLQPRADSLITEDESDADERTPRVVPKTVGHAFQKTTTTSAQPQKLNTLPLAASKKPLTQTKSYNKGPMREIFNPLVQSPVKKKVEAFESVAAAAAINKPTRNPRSKLAKESSQCTPSSSSTSTTTPIIGRQIPSAATSSLITPNCMLSLGKKLPASASKAIGLIKSSSAGNLKMPASAKAPSRANSAEDFRRGLHQLAEDRKKQREQKHLQAAQQREAKERERAERMAKAAKEREEKRLLKQQLAEQKQRELQEIQRKLKQQEEALAAAAAAEAAAQKEKLMKISQMQQQNAAISGSAKARMLPPQPKTKYIFEMLHEDDSTDEEGKVTYKRPPPPQWSLSHVRGPAILAQEHMPTEPIDSLFSVQPRTLDLKMIFPKIDPRYLKRNSSVIWQTPPRYSELPKY